MIQAAEPAGTNQVDEDFVLIERAARLCNPFFEALGEVTLNHRRFAPLAATVLNWNASIFRPTLQALILKVMEAASEGGSFEVTMLDCQLDTSLPKSLRAQSREEGRKLVQGVLAPRGDRMIERYRQSVIAGDSPGHLAVIHALRATAFHLPPRVLMASYLLQEGTGAGMNEPEISRFLLGGVCGTIEFKVHHG